MDCTLSDHQQIVVHLNLLVKNKVSLSVKADGEQLFLAMLVLVDQQQRRIVFEKSALHWVNVKALGATKLSLQCVFEGVKVDFEVTKVAELCLDGEDLFAATIPQSILWYQRREYYRVKTPLFMDSKLVVNTGDAEIALPLFDISITGLALLTPVNLVDQVFQLKTHFDGSLLILEELNQDYVSFCTHYAQPHNPSRTVSRLGCEFTKISKSFEARIQRYMQKIECKNKRHRH